MHEFHDGNPLLEVVMHGGARLVPSPPLSAVRERTAAELAMLPETLRDPLQQGDYSVDISPALQALAEEIDRGPH